MGYNNEKNIKCMMTKKGLNQLFQNLLKSVNIIDTNNKLSKAF